MFFTHLDNFLPFSSNLKLSSANSFSLEESKICYITYYHFGNGLKLNQLKTEDMPCQLKTFCREVFKGKEFCLGSRSQYSVDEKIFLSCR